MARKRTETVEKAIAPADQPERFRIGEIGYSGLSIFDGVTNEEIKRELNFPYNIKTYREMSYHTSVNACLQLYENLISKVTWRIVPPKDASEEEKKQAEFVGQCLHDMDIPFRQVIKDALSSNVYGFAVLEKVYRRRNTNSGSMYSDNKIALKKIALRSQETIEKFIFDDSGNEILGVKQNLTNVQNGKLYGNRSKQELEVVLPRSKVMLVTTGRNRNDPYGKSPLRDVYLAWRYLTVIQEIEAAGVARDLQGMPVLKIPAQYMSDDASPDQKAIYENFKNIIRNIQNNSQSGVILPSQTDPETRQPLFDLTLLSTEGGKKNFDTGKVKEYYQNMIYTGMSADILIMGQGGVGSFALGQIKNSLTGSAVESMLDNIVDVFNRDVVRQLYELNGWDISRAAKLDYEDLNTVDLETTSKAFQRFASTGLFELDRDILNKVRTLVGVDKLPDNAPVDEESLTGNTSRSGDGMATAGEGTSNSPSGEDTSSNNLENSA
jgi:hypothetical protein